MVYDLTTGYTRLRTTHSPFFACIGHKQEPSYTVGNHKWMTVCLLTLMLYLCRNVEPHGTASLKNVLWVGNTVIYTLHTCYISLRQQETTQGAPRNQSTPAVTITLTLSGSSNTLSYIGISAHSKSK